ncbi:MAG: L-threonine 3-dehydrogenase [Conexivisphaerales archaeon]
MKAIVKQRAEAGADFVDLPEPEIGNREILVRVKACSICGTDVHIYDYNAWAKSKVRIPVIIGHEFSGEVVEVGKEVDSVQIGDHVSGETHIPCFRCEQCRKGNYHICENLRLRGVDVNGCFAEYLAMDAFTAWKNPKEIPHEVASVQEPLGNAVHTVFEGGGVEGKVVAIFGCGPIGMAAAAVCKASGAEKVIAVDISEYRLQLASNMGADILVNPNREEPLKSISDATKGKGVDVFLEMAGVQQTLSWGLKALKPGGRAALLGIYDSSVSVDVSNDIVMKNIEVRGIFGRRMFADWYTVSSYLRSGKVDLTRLITHEFPLNQFQKAFEVMKSGKSGKVVMKP